MPSRRTVAAVGLAGVLALGVASCSSGDGAGSPSATTRSDGATGGSATSAPSDGGSTVVVQDFSFRPATVTVPSGTAVRFQNHDGFTHTVTSGKPGDDTGDFDVRLSAGTEDEVTVDAPGSYPYFCSIHEQMRGEIVVTAG